MPFFIEPKVELTDKDFSSYDKIAARLGLKAYVILNEKYKKKVKGEKKESIIDHITRYEIRENTVEKVRKILPNVRLNYEIISIQTSSPKVAQWVVKDNRVDILSIANISIREIITGPLANVAAENNTFFEIDLSSLLNEKSNSSMIMRNISRAINILLKEKVKFIFTFNVSSPLEFRDKRGIISIGKLLGVPEDIIRKNYHDFFSLVELNRNKLSDNFVAPGISIVSKEIDDSPSKLPQSDESSFNEFEFLDIPISLEEHTLTNKKLERQRYLLFEIMILKDEKISDKALLETFWSAYTSLFGAVGSSRAGVYLSYYNNEENYGILRCSNYSINSVRATLTLISKINDLPVLIHVLKTSGTIKNLKDIARKKQK
ncbi:MAG TPA: Rpp14/Pop5 family protein [Candidatus Bathyarchaeia archaeon]|nr:Rpp14/Pop5 family protein [Candidatus Bathyarchaeia archaeon]